MESKHSRFVRLGEKRTNDLIAKIRLIGNLANRHNYEYSPTEVKQIFEAIDAELQTAKDKFQSQEDGAPEKFKLKE